MSYTFIYPGQGSQKVGMGAGILASSTFAQDQFKKASDILGFDLTKIVLEGPDEDLKKTEFTQPALFVLEAVLTDLLKEKGISPVTTMGHSLGEYSALYGAGVFSFEDGVKLVGKRGALMAAAGASSNGTMAAIIGMDKDDIVTTLTKVTSGVVVSANENAPDQTVISGEVAAVEEACTLLKEAGAKRAIILAVSGAFHSPLMQKAAEEFELFLKEITFNSATVPVITNVTAKPETDGNRLKALLVEQLLSPVRWVDAQAALLGSGNSSCIEVGPGNVLKGLARKYSRDIKVVSCSDSEGLEALTN